LECLENGALMNVIQKEDFHYLVTSDKNLQHQQNISKYTISFIVLNVINNNYETILPLVDEIKLVLLDDPKVELKVIRVRLKACRESVRNQIQLAEKPSVIPRGFFCHFRSCRRLIF